MQNQIAGFIKRQRLQPKQAEPALRTDLLDQPRHMIGINLVGCMAEQAQQHRHIRAVALAGSTERTKQLGPQPRHLPQHAVALQTLRKLSGGAHGPHGV